MKSIRIKNNTIEIWRDTSEVSQRAAELFVKAAKESIEAKGSFTVAFSGGSTPKVLYKLLAQEEPYVSQIDWSVTHIFWSDERCVPPDDEQSNYRMAYEALLGHVAIPANQIHRMRGEDGPDVAASNYEKELLEHFGKNEPRFDLVLLGMGDDGHTASLFPNTTAIEEKEKLVAAPFVQKFNNNRLTLTYKTINAAARILFLVTGESKAETLRSVLEDGPQKQFPASLVEVSNGDLIWLIDKRAASIIAFSEDK